MPKRMLNMKADTSSQITSDSSASKLQRSAVVIQQPCPTSSSKSGLLPARESIENTRKYHTVTTTFGFANHWQARIHYYWFKKQRSICEETGICDMGGFTRLLHSGQADDLMDEIPTVVVDKLPESAMKNSNYVVLNRPYAFLLWLQRVSIPEKYILMAEADHLFLRPLPNMMNGEAPGAALFTYIVPENYGPIVRKFVGQITDAELKTVPHIGNSPTFVSIKHFRKTAPMWFNTTMDIFNDEEAHKAWNWVLEMYGYSLATYKLNQHIGMKVWDNMLAHPPFDKKEVTPAGDPFYILHLTYPLRYNSTGGMTEKEEDTVWKFDKRSYMEKPPPKNLPDPPVNVDNDLARIIIRMVNEATNNIPCWDLYLQEKTVTTMC